MTTSVKVYFLSGILLCVFNGKINFTSINEIKYVKTNVDDSIPSTEKLKFDSIRLDTVIITKLEFKNDRGSEAFNFEFIFSKQDGSIIKVNQKAFPYISKGKALPMLGGYVMLIKSYYYLSLQQRSYTDGINKCDYYAQKANSFKWPDTISVEIKVISNCNEIELFINYVDIDNKVYRILGILCLDCKSNFKDPHSGF